MPGIITEPAFKTLTVKELHPTFAAEVEGADFLNMTEEQFGEVKAAMAKVRSFFYVVCLCSSLVLIGFGGCSTAFASFATLAWTMIRMSRSRNGWVLWMT